MMEANLREASAVPRDLTDWCAPHVHTCTRTHRRKHTLTVTHYTLTRSPAQCTQTHIRKEVLCTVYTCTHVGLHIHAPTTRRCANTHLHTYMRTHTKPQNPLNKGARTQLPTPYTYAGVCKPFSNVRSACEPMQGRAHAFTVRSCTPVHLPTSQEKARVGATSVQAQAGAQAGVLAVRLSPHFPFSFFAFCVWALGPEALSATKAPHPCCWAQSWAYWPPSTHLSVACLVCSGPHAPLPASPPPNQLGPNCIFHPAPATLRAQGPGRPVPRVRAGGGWTAAGWGKLC